MNISIKIFRQQLGREIRGKKHRGDRDQQKCRDHSKTQGGNGHHENAITPAVPVIRHSASTACSYLVVIRASIFVALPDRNGGFTQFCKPTLWLGVNRRNRE